MDTAELDALLTEVRRAGAGQPMHQLHEALLDLDAPPSQRSLVLCDLATTHLARSEVAVAEVYARRALSLARKQGNERAEARALLVCAQIDLHRWAAGELGDDRFMQAITALEGAAEIYDRLDAIDLLPVLIAIAEAIVAAGEPASAVLLYQRVLVDARKPAWVQQGPELADGLCARACFGLAECSLAEHRHDEARAHLERALALTTRYALDATRRRMLADLADMFELGLGDQLQAHRLRKQLRS